MSSNSTILVLVRPLSSTGSTKGNTVNSLTVNSLSQDMFINFPHSIVIQELILVNLKMVEYRLTESEHCLVTKDLNGALVNCKSTGMLIECADC